jgi:hypothetical protein
VRSLEATKKPWVPDAFYQDEKHIFHNDVVKLFDLDDCDCVALRSNLSKRQRGNIGLQ